MVSQKDFETRCLFVKSMPISITNNYVVTISLLLSISRETAEGLQYSSATHTIQFIPEIVNIFKRNEGASATPVVIESKFSNMTYMSLDCC